MENCSHSMSFCGTNVRETLLFVQGPSSAKIVASLNETHIVSPAFFSYLSASLAPPKDKDRGSGLQFAIGLAFAEPHARNNRKLIFGSDVLLRQDEAA